MLSYEYGVAIVDNYICVCVCVLTGMKAVELYNISLYQAEGSKTSWGDDVPSFTYLLF